MAQPKNLEARNKIINATNKLFITNGYNATTYKDISKKTGFTRSRIQSYFPEKKHLAKSFFDRFLIMINDYMEKSNLNSNNSLRNMCILGQIYTSFLFSTEKLRIFIYDIIRNRDLTDEVISFNYLAFHELVSNEDIFQITEEHESYIIRSIGGIYEYLYYSLKHRKNINVASLIVSMFYEFLNYIKPTGFDTCVDLELLESEIAQACSVLYTEILKEN